MKTYCLSCRKHKDNIGPRKVVKTNKAIRQTSKYTNCVAAKSKFSKQSLLQKVVRGELILNY